MLRSRGGLRVAFGRQGSRPGLRALALTSPGVFGLSETSEKRDTSGNTNEVSGVTLLIGSLLRSADGLDACYEMGRMLASFSFYYQKSELVALFPVIPQLFRGDSVLLEG